MSIPLEEHYVEVAHHLDHISAGAIMCARNARQLVRRPEFLTLAEDDLRRCEAVLEKALADVRRALATYRSIERESMP